MRRQKLRNDGLYDLDDRAAVCLFRDSFHPSEDASLFSLTSETLLASWVECEFYSHIPLPSPIERLASVTTHNRETR